MNAPLHELRAAEQRAAQAERTRIVRWLRMRIEVASAPGARLPVPPAKLAEFISNIMNGVADVIEQDKHPK